MAALFFDERLSPRLVTALADVFPNSTHVNLIGLAGATDRALFDYAREHGFVLVSRDTDFEAMSVARGAPPKVLILRISDGPPSVAADALRRSAPRIRLFLEDESNTCLTLG